MDLGIKGRVAVVAASSGGLGFATALQLAKAGATIVINGRKEPELRSAAEKIETDTGASVLAVIADVSVESDAHKLIDSAVDRFGRLDILVTNAGGPPAGFFDDFAEEDYRKAIEINLISTVSLCRRAVPVMRRNKWGRIAAITSITIKQLIENLILSNTSRAATVGFLKSLSQQVGPDGITVNTLCPGHHLTERLRSLASHQATKQGVPIEEVLNGMASATAVRRLGDPLEFGALAAFLCSEQAGFITGTAIPVDGGWYKGLL